MDEVQAPGKRRKLWFPNRAGAALGFSILTLGIFMLVAIEEAALSNVSIFGPSGKPYPLVFRVITLIPFWASIGATFALAALNRKWTRGAVISIVIACLIGLFEIWIGFYLTSLSLWPRQG